MSVGVDIGSKSIKIVELVKDGKGWRLKASGVVGFKGLAPEYAKDEKDLSLVAEAIKKLYKEAKIGSKDVSISLPEHSVYTRTIKFPPLTDAEIASAVKWEAEQYIPIPLNEAILQHQIIERKENISPPHVSVLLVAVLREIVDKYAKVVDMAKLNLVSVETELMSIVRSLAIDEAPVMIVDLGARSTDIAIAKNGQLYFSRSLQTAGEAFTRAIVQNLGIDETQAEEYKKTYGMNKTQLEGKIKSALEPVFRMVADEMKKAISYYQSSEQGESPKSAILTGGSAAMPEVASVLTRLLGLEVVVGNPFSKVFVAPEAVNALAGYAPLYSVAVGLAMRG
ncbi:MAG: Type IV pilus biogenesis ATPase PilM [Candidatus Woesebacteria bacterium GW2011_GWA1_37_8]|uniref:Type IV pilus biogenesis ATPase PilM n=2 Tax=Candidatus Woeseibacteriota TaxID=1752722 RepID=A0A0G0L4V3_9BACT|nr:MAG: Type IV pilus biogenesis ATPase PilM [Microgenomates group bacterium GW2011_GWC1_37_12b]KKQ45497.1 MAG: Type IV pilus biogenesis ATPase PilM [Candidatus Woesebacteria bacterium GW2011_GWA1_37_8]KKQ87023.1 MAG: Type IV pilus biogenesis ATPase PilM [Candidatus Woesebacteria bacterium GW2011_GWB1_38_8b]